MTEHDDLRGTTVLAPHNVQQFKEQGYTTVPDFFEPAETQAMQVEVRRWLANDLPRDVSTRPSEQQNLQLMPLHTHSELFRALPFAPKVIDAVGALIGHPVIKILDQMFTKPAHSGMGTNWHTDNAYFGLSDPLAGTAMWIAIDDANATNGTLKVVPRAFDESFAHGRDADSNHHIRTRVDETRAIPCELDAGGVVFFCFGTPHATGNNATDATRSGVGIHFVNHAKHQGLASERWQEIHLSGPGATSGRDEYGGEVDFASEVATVLAASSE